MSYSRGTFVKYVLQWLASKNKAQAHDCAPKDSKEINDQDVAIYCIHGTADYADAFSHIVKNIKTELASDIKSLHQPSFEGRFQLRDIIFFANQLKDKVLTNKHQKIILMGHSRGALVASYFTEYLAKEYGIEVVATINICGPFSGTRWAVFPFTYSESVNQMRLESPFLKDLTHRMKSSGNKYHYFAGSRDILVPPSHAFIKEHAKYVIELDEDHLSIMFSSHLINHLKNIINNIVQNKAQPPTEQTSNVFSMTYDADQKHSIEPGVSSCKNSW